MYYRYKYIKIRDEYFLAGRTILRTKETIPFENIGTIRPEVYFDEDTGAYLYKRIPNPKHTCLLPQGLENLPYTIIEESSGPTRPEKFKVSTEDLAIAVVALRHGDTTKIDDIEQKLNEIKRE